MSNDRPECPRRNLGQEHTPSARALESNLPLPTMMSRADAERLSMDVKQSPEVMTWNAAAGELETWS